MSEKPVINVNDVPLTDRGNGKSFAVKWGRVGPVIGLNALGCAVHVVPPGKKAFPFHRHHVMDELFFIVSGEGQYRWGEDVLPVKVGDLVAAPAGTKAHQLINTGNVELRYLGISSVAATEVVDYPQFRQNRCDGRRQEWRFSQRELFGHGPHGKGRLLRRRREIGRKNNVIA